MTFRRIILLFILVITSSLSYASNCAGPRHHIFLLHGIGGDRASFGHLPEVLNQEDICQRVRTFEYRTGSNQNTYQFAYDFHRFVTSFPSVEIRSFDKISLVMHSQGGLVGTLWLKYLVENDHPLKHQLDSFITLSTPFWGADIANIGKRFFYTLPEGVNNPISPFGRNELNEMSYGSFTIRDLAQNAEAIFKGIPKLRPLIVSGLKKVYNSVIGEDDLVVPTYSMRLEHYYLQDNLNLSERPMIIGSDLFTRTESKPFVIVDADHIKATQPGVAKIPKACLKNCTHPSINPILKHLKGEKVEQEKNYQIERFRVNVLINNPFKINYDDKDLRITIHGLDKDTKVPWIERFRPGFGNAKLERGLSFSFTGIARKKGPQALFVTLIYKNKKVKTYEVPVEAGHSSFVDATLTE